MTADAPDDAARRARVATDRAMIRQLAHYCGPAMLKLAVLTQNFVSWMWSPGSNGIGSARDQDNAELDRAKRRRSAQARRDLYTTEVVLHTVTRCELVLDELEGMRAMYDAAAGGARVVVAPGIIARSVLEVSLLAKYQLAGTLEDRLIRAYALKLADFYSASQPQQLVVAAGIEQENDDIVKQYHAHRDLAELLQYDLDERGDTTIYGKPRVRAVQSRADPAVRATVTTNVTDLAKTQAPPAEYQWRVASGATHGGMWATEGELIRVEAGVSRGAPLVAAATTAVQGTETLLEAMAAYVCVESGRAPWLTRFAEINRGLYEKVRDLGFFAKSPG